jgi:hypothetical protein
MCLLFFLELIVGRIEDTALLVDLCLLLLHDVLRLLELKSHLIIHLEVHLIF